MRVEIIGRSRALIHAVELADRFAATPMPILLVGATGTGKELFAQLIHEMSGRHGPLVAVNCAALPRDMVESLLFGHRRGAFTGAVDAAVGYVEAAAGGTLFLDEISSLLGEAQVKLLRVLETKEVNRLGETQLRRVDFRVVSAAQEDVRARLESGALRLDLYQRVAGIVVELPPLRERRDDIMPLAEHFARLGGRSLEVEAEPVLLNHEWPGNVRELRMVIERAGCLSEHEMLPPRALAEAIALGVPALGSAAGPGVEVRSPAAADRDHERMIAVCKEHGWDAHDAAAALGMARSTLYRKLRDVGVSLHALRLQSATREHSRIIVPNP